MSALSRLSMLRRAVAPGSSAAPRSLGLTRALSSSAAAAPPTWGKPISMGPDGLVVPDTPIIPFIEGDGTGPDIWRSSVRAINAAVEKAYNGSRKLAWVEVMAGEKAFKTTGSWLPEETLDAFKKYRVGIKGPLTTPSALF